MKKFSEAPIVNGVETDVEFMEFGGLSSEVQEKVADWLHDRTRRVPNMLTVKPEDVFSKFIGCVALKGAGDEAKTEIVGYVGAMESEVHEGQEMSEVGSLYIEGSYRKHMVKHGGELLRISRVLVSMATCKLKEKDIVPYAFCNPASEPIFKITGYEPKDLSKVPSSAKVLCETSCELFDKCHPDRCCDTIMVLE